MERADLTETRVSEHTLGMLQFTSFILNPLHRCLANFPHIRMVGLEIYDAATNSLPQHWNDGLELCMVLEGEFTWVVEGKEVQVRGGEATVTRPWEIHGGSGGIMNRGVLAWIVVGLESGYDLPLAVGPWSRLCSTPGAALLERLTDASLTKLGRIPELERLFFSLQRELEDQDLGHEYRVNGIVDDMLILVCRHCQPTESSDGVANRLDRLLREVSAHPEKDWQVSQLSEQLGLSVSTFIKHVREKTGLTPKNYLVHARIQAACSLLADTGRNVTDIAFDTGFSSSQFFSTLFRKYTGLSPRQWRENAKKQPLMPPPVPGHNFLDHSTVPPFRVS